MKPALVNDTHVQEEEGTVFTCGPGHYIENLSLCTATHFTKHFIIFSSWGFHNLKKKKSSKCEKVMV